MDDFPQIKESRLRGDVRETTLTGRHTKSHQSIYDDMLKLIKVIDSKNGY